MADVAFDLRTAAPPATVLAALTDFTARRPDLWPALDPDAYRVHSLGPTSALVREGQRSPRLWALEQYDWSTPGAVVWTVRESNFCAPGSFMSATVTPGDDGGSHIAVRWSRRGTGLKGRLIVGLVRATKGKPVAAGLTKAFDAMQPKKEAPA